MVDAVEAKDQVSVHSAVCLANSAVSAAHCWGFNLAFCHVRLRVVLANKIQ